MKGATSVQISKFLSNVEHGLIAGKPDSSGPRALERMCDALRAILDGADPDIALGIERSSGRERKGFPRSLAHAIHDARMRREKWSVIELKVNAFLERNGEKPLSLSRIKTLYKEQLPDIETDLSIQRMLDRINARL